MHRSFVERSVVGFSSQDRGYFSTTQDGQLPRRSPLFPRRYWDLLHPLLLAQRTATRSHEPEGFGATDCMPDLTLLRRSFACRISPGVAALRRDWQTMAECGRRGLSLLEEARSRYESLQISDDVFGESGDDSSENPFYSTTGDSNSDNYTETNTVDARAGETRNQSCGPPGSVSNGQAQEEGWSDTLQDFSVPHYQDTHGKFIYRWALINWSSC